MSITKSSALADAKTLIVDFRRMTRGSMPAALGSVRFLLATIAPKRFVRPSRWYPFILKDGNHKGLSASLW